MTAPGNARAAGERHAYIAIEGPIGVGKSSLARRLARHRGAELLLEQPADNPFLGRFYADMKAYAFQTQLHFLFQRVEQVRAAAQPGMFANGLVSDFLFAKDRLFAQLNLNDDEFRLYRQIYRQVEPRVREPDLVIWLQAAPEVLAQRIRHRAIAMEQAMPLDYLERLCDAYIEHFRRDVSAPVLSVATDRFNPIENDADFEALLTRIERFTGPREFFDPAAGATLG